MNTWERTIDMPGKKPIVDSGKLDPVFAILGDEKSSVKMEVGFNLPFGAAKVTCTVHLTCGQREPLIEKAAELAFERALKFSLHGLDLASGHAVRSDT